MAKTTYTAKLCVTFNLSDDELGIIMAAAADHFDKSIRQMIFEDGYLYCHNSARIAARGALKELTSSSDQLRLIIRTLTHCIIDGAPELLQRLQAIRVDMNTRVEMCNKYLKTIT